MDPSDLIVLVVIILVILIIGYPMVRDSVFRARAKREGVFVDATITHKHMNRGRVGASCSLEYTYSSYERLEFVPRQAYEAVEEGDQIKIVYLFSKPQDARIIDPRITGEKKTLT